MSQLDFKCAVIKNNVESEARLKRRYMARKVWGTLFVLNALVAMSTADTPTGLLTLGVCGAVAVALAGFAHLTDILNFDR